MEALGLGLTATPPGAGAPPPAGDTPGETGSDFSALMGALAPTAPSGGDAPVDASAPAKDIDAGADVGEEQALATLAPLLCAIPMAPTPPPATASREEMAPVMAALRSLPAASTKVVAPVVAGDDDAALPTASSDRADDAATTAAVAAAMAGHGADAATVAPPSPAQAEARTAAADDAAADPVPAGSMPPFVTSGPNAADPAAKAASNTKPAGQTLALTNDDHASRPEVRTAASESRQRRASPEVAPRPAAQHAEATVDVLSRRAVRSSGAPVTGGQSTVATPAQAAIGVDTKVATSPTVAPATSAAPPPASGIVPVATAPTTDTRRPPKRATTPETPEIASSGGADRDLAASAQPPIAAPQPSLTRAAASFTATPSAGTLLAATGTDRSVDAARTAIWVDGIARDIAAAGATSGTARFTVAPERLGTIHVEVTRDGASADVAITAASADARAILADAQPQLLADARANGLDIRHARVDLGADAGAGSGGGAAGRQARQPEPDRPAPRAAIARTVPAGAATATGDGLYA